MKYLVMCKVYTDMGGIKWLYHVCPPVRKIIHSLKLVDYLHVQADNPWYNYYIIYHVIFQRPFRNVQVQIMYKQHVNFMIGIWVWSNQTALRFGVCFN